MYTYTCISWCVYTNLCGRTSSDSVSVILFALKHIDHIRSLQN